jgi:non-heme chloroperoxidase
MNESTTLDDTVALRRKFIIGSAGVAFAASLPAVTLLQPVEQAHGSSSSQQSQGEHTMSYVTTQDGRQIYYRDWSSGQPVVFSHGWPLTGDAFEDQMFCLASKGYRCIAHDRRGHGWSSQPWNGNDLDTYADDLAALVEALDLRTESHSNVLVISAPATRKIVEREVFHRRRPEPWNWTGRPNEALTNVNRPTTFCQWIGP